ncbi:MAG: DUF3047 domain-containing protein [Desulforhopalus sp.]
MHHFAVILLLVLFGVFPATEGVTKENVCIHEDFSTLNDWRPLKFPKINILSEYTIVQDGANNMLQAVANNSASGILYTKTFDIRQCPVVSWRWKVRNVYLQGDAQSKQGDDYPLRIYVLFKYNPDRAGFAKRIQYSIVKSIQGEFPPDSSLSYIWANREQSGKVIANAYTNRAMMIVLQTGSARINTWVDEKVNALADYRLAFGREPPKEAMLAVMSDADDTGESAAAWLDFIEVGREH